MMIEHLLRTGPSKNRRHSSFAKSSVQTSHTAQNLSYNNRFLGVERSALRLGKFLRRPVRLSIDLSFAAKLCSKVIPERRIFNNHFIESRCTRKNCGPGCRSDLECPGPRSSLFLPNCSAITHSVR